MVDVEALFLTWTTYGTWLPGDERGHVSNTLLPGSGYERKENRPGRPYHRGDAYARERARQLQKGPTVWLSSSEALVVATSLTEVSLARGWMILRAAVMTNHVHTVVSRCQMDGAAVRRILKGNSQAALSGEGLSQRWWTAGGSDRRRSGESSVTATIRYVADQPGKLAEIIENVVSVPDGESDWRG